jgi:hypothetical protein
MHLLPYSPFFGSATFPPSWCPGSQQLLASFLSKASRSLRLVSLQTLTVLIGSWGP